MGGGFRSVDLQNTRLSRSLATFWFAFCVCLVGHSQFVVADDGETFFEEQIRPILERSCLECHGAKKQESGLRLDSKSFALRGGDRGPAFFPGDSKASLLVTSIRQTGEVKMPPEGKLAPSEVAALTTWIDRGAPWPESARQSPNGIRSGEITPQDRDFWSFRPLAKTEPPAVRDASWPWSAIDRHILGSLEAKGLTPNSEADKETLIRRATLDLTGLLPTVGEIDAFLQDESSDAFDRVVERLLASTAYGERWGRHWLDVVRFADTSGLTSDHPVPQARLYRDYVIAAFNRDMPYDQFIREQFAGDILATKEHADPERFAELVTATGYIAVSRRFGYEPNDDQHLTIQDTIDNLGQTFLGLSLGCARCHDHKFEPVTMRDYYALYGIFESTYYPYTGAEYQPLPRGFASLIPPQQAEQRKAVYDAKLAELTAAINALKQEIPTTIDQTNPSANRSGQLVELERKCDQLIDEGPFPLAYSVSEGAAHNARIQRRGEPGKPGDLVPRRFLEVFGGQSMPGAETNNDDWRVALLNEPLQLQPEREYLVSVNINTYYVNSRETELLPVANSKVEFRRGVYGEPRRFPTQTFGRGYFVDIVLEGDVEPYSPNLFADHPPQQLRGTDGKSYELGSVFSTAKPQRVKAIRYFKSPDEVGEHTGNLWDSDGNVLATVRFTESGESGRRELADWIATPQNPLTARVMVNRIWQNHFGYGLVRSENDFGHRGDPPSHPELIDHLAEQFIRSGWSIKSIHRLIMASHVYRLSSHDDHANSSVDPENRWFWRYSRQRLSAEAIRDNLLALGGGLQRGPAPPHPFPPARTWAFTQHSPFTAVYDHDFRSVYLMQQRLKRHPFFALFDGADPNSSVPRRLNTTVPNQALFLMNATFVHDQVAKFAAKLIEEDPNPQKRIVSAYRQAIARFPTESEIQRCVRLLGDCREQLAADDVDEKTRERLCWSALAHSLFSLNEFLFLE